MRTKDIEKVFIKRCEEYAKEIGAIDTQIDREKNETRFSIYLAISRITFVYRTKVSEFDHPSTLYARIHLKKNRDVFFQIPELLSFLGIEDFRAFCFPYIENEKRFNSCFDALTNILNDHWKEFENITLQGRYDELQNLQKSRLCKFHELNEEVINEFSDYEIETFQAELCTWHEEFEFLFRYTINTDYYSFCLGKTQKAKKKYVKKVEKDEATDYEKMLLEFISKPENAGFRPMPDECFAYRDSQAYLYGSDGFPCSWQTVAVSMLFGIALFVSASLLVSWFLSRGTIGYFGADWWISGIFGAVAGVPIAVLMPERVKAILKDKKAKFNNEFQDIVESEKWTSFTKYLIHGAIAILLTFTVWLSSISMRLYDTYGQYPTIDKPIGWTYFQYEDIENAYYMNARYNEWDGRIERPSYVIVMANGDIIDFDGYTSVEKTEEIMLPILEKYGVEIINVDSGEEIPGYDKWFEENYE